MICRFVYQVMSSYPRVKEDSRGLMEMMVHQDLAEDLGREVPWETVDQLEDRYIFRRHVMT